jgi:predicted MFS family arabinose efflux permease
MSRIFEALVPARLGIGFRWLLASSWTTNLSDGLALAAGPLLVASQTDDAFVVASSALLQWLPPLLFGPFAGVLTDRLDRRRLVITVDLIRVVIISVLAVAIVGGAVSVPLVLVTLFLLATAEMFADNASSTLLPMIVHRDDLAIGNARLQAGFITVNQLAGPPIGAALFVVGMSWPFFAQGVLVLLGAVLVSRIRLPDREKVQTRATTMRSEIVEGFRWAVRHPAIRTLILTILIFNVTFGAAWSVLVLYATDRLGLGEVGFGLITTAGALGGLIGTLSYDWITKRVSLANIMRAGLIIETFTHLGLAVTTTPWVALTIFFVFGAHAFIWGTTSITIRQRAVPLELQGRVGSANLMGVFGGLVAGSAVGGLLARSYGLAAPFWFAFGGSALFVVLIWRQLAHISHADDQPGTLPDL